jgi:hypothetical protein
MKINLQRRLPLPRSRLAYRTLAGWALSVLIEESAVTECEYHGPRRDRADPDAVRRARERAWSEPFLGETRQACLAAIEAELQAIGDACPECD